MEIPPECERSRPAGIARGLNEGQVGNDREQGDREEVEGEKGRMPVPIEPRMDPMEHK